ncbi:solute carrier family 66 member 2 isoform X1 [Toxorhynchites rutilus septentrionalis]|uniref:solute carrier family 66 member 2 isoform X1 n=1 Tax=Toxorhynchites rutilus septentrionalis TaxID=329112 RepID=UPI002479E2EE|nr:solute carrier family 66 member 2 isoform X1 [Toxorhynchites rutilus septentrionalis]XP_055636957.1 solute carrier family 66 member 2 isoform X1 [Toxorhynchites rutilus septentrionalis]XP_055636958.1 solute carrier family 66 member 2 isoform X1 [Toxorhynchites rutilus septentrionalis]
MDWIINDELGLTVGHVVGYVSASFMVVGGVLPYIPQYKQIKRTQDPEGFSLHVCLALLIANTLRILFWFSSRFEIPLLVQSVVMNIAMFIMIHVCVTVRRNNAIMRTRERVFSGDETLLEARGSINRAIDEHPKCDGVINSRAAAPGVLPVSATAIEGAGKLANSTIIGIGSTLPPVAGAPGYLKKSRSRHYIVDFDTRYFWNWTDFQSYLDFMLVVWVVGAAITYLMLSVTWFMETIGFLAVFTEAMLGAPQFVRNYKNKSTHGMSICMVVMWTAGDMFKTGYFILRHAPTQFWICGTLQVSLDLAILLQVYIYRRNPPRSTHRGD